MTIEDLALDSTVTQLYTEKRETLIQLIQERMDWMDEKNKLPENPTIEEVNNIYRAYGKVTEALISLKTMKKYDYNSALDFLKQFENEKYLEIKEELRIEYGPKVGITQKDIDAKMAVKYKTELARLRHLVNIAEAENSMYERLNNYWERFQWSISGVLKAQMQEQNLIAQDARYGSFQLTKYTSHVNLNICCWQLVDCVN